MLKNIIAWTGVFFATVLGVLIGVFLKALPWIAVIGFCYWLFFM